MDASSELDTMAGNLESVSKFPRLIIPKTRSRLILSRCLACIVCGSWFLELEMARPYHYDNPDVKPSLQLMTQLLHEWWNTEITTG